MFSVSSDWAKMKTVVQAALSDAPAGYRCMAESSVKSNKKQKKASSKRHKTVHLISCNLFSLVSIGTQYHSQVRSRKYEKYSTRSREQLGNS